MGRATLEAETHTVCVRDSAWTLKRDAAQVAWAATPIPERLGVLRNARHRMAEMADAFSAAVAPELARTAADTRIAEVLPLLDACRFLERESAGILAARRLGRRGLPLWLSGVDNEVQRVALGKVLVIGPANYPLFLPGVQALQGLAAGNSVVWKPGRGGQGVANLFKQAMDVAGLAPGLLRITEDSVEAGRAEIEVGADKVFFTGSAQTGRALLRQLAETATPCVMELSGCDSVIVLASANMSRVVAALTFGMRLNGSATCMAPRRVVVVGSTHALEAKLITSLAEVQGIRIPAAARGQLGELLQEAKDDGAKMLGEVEDLQRPVILLDVQPVMRIAQSDLFAPILMVMQAEDIEEAVTMQDACPFALTVSIFGEESEARALAMKLTAGTVLVNDLIVPTVDPRVPFGGRRGSGFGVTRGAEGLFEMTAVKVIAVRRGRSTRHFEATTERHETFFDALIYAGHAATWQLRWRGLRHAVSAARNLKQKVFLDKGIRESNGNQRRK